MCDVATLGLAIESLRAASKFGVRRDDSVVFGTIAVGTQTRRSLSKIAESDELARTSAFEISRYRVRTCELKASKTSRTNQRSIAHLDISLQGTGSNGTNELFGSADSNRPGLPDCKYSVRILGEK
jgi:hypothetical protein